MACSRYVMTAGVTTIVLHLLLAPVLAYPCSSSGSGSGSGSGSSKEPNWDDDGCYTFYQCYGSSGSLENCPKGYQFHYEHKQCEKDENVFCKWQKKYYSSVPLASSSLSAAAAAAAAGASLASSSSSSSSSSHGPSRKECFEEHGLEPDYDAKHCQTYYQCEHHHGFLKHCPRGYQFDWNSKKCEEDKAVLCQHQRHSGSSYSGGGGGGKGNYECQKEQGLEANYNAKHCDSYYLCVDYQGSLKLCPHGYQFDWHDKKCYEDKYVYCQDQRRRHDHQQSSAEEGGNQQDDFSWMYPLMAASFHGMGQTQPLAVSMGMAGGLDGPADLGGWGGGLGGGWAGGLGGGLGGLGGLVGGNLLLRGQPGILGLRGAGAAAGVQGNALQGAPPNQGNPNNPNANPAVNPAAGNPGNPAINPAGNPGVNPAGNPGVNPAAGNPAGNQGNPWQADPNIVVDPINPALLNPAGNPAGNPNVFQGFGNLNPQGFPNAQGLSRKPVKSRQGLGGKWEEEEEEEEEEEREEEEGVAPGGKVDAGVGQQQPQQGRAPKPFLGKRRLTPSPHPSYNDNKNIKQKVTGKPHLLQPFQRTPTARAIPYRPSTVPDISAQNRRNVWIYSKGESPRQSKLGGKILGNHELIPGDTGSTVSASDRDANVPEPAAVRQNSGQDVFLARGFNVDPTSKPPAGNSEASGKAGSKGPSQQHGSTPSDEAGLSPTHRPGASPNDESL